MKVFRDPVGYALTCFSSADLTRPSVRRMRAHAPGAPWAHRPRSSGSARPAPVLSQHLRPASARGAGSCPDGLVPTDVTATPLASVSARTQRSRSRRACPSVGACGTGLQRERDLLRRLERATQRHGPRQVHHQHRRRGRDDLRAVTSKSSGTRWKGAPRPSRSSGHDRASMTQLELSRTRRLRSPGARRGGRLRHRVVAQAVLFTA